MDPAAPAAAAPAAAAPAAAAPAAAAPAAAAPAAAPPGQALAQAPALAQINGQEVAGNERACLWRPWLSSINDQPRQARSLVDWAAGGATAAEATKADSEFHHPVRLYWPKSRSFDYLYSAGEMLLHNFPVQATINLYEDSNSEDDEEDKEEDEEEEEEVNESEPEECVGVPEVAPHKATAHSPDPHSTSPN